MSDTTPLPTVNDLRTKQCYICHDEETDGDAPTLPPRLWVHPCNCTLVAHEECLLQWIQSAQEQRGRLNPSALKCPQCAAPYEVMSDRSALLDVLDIGTVLGNIGAKFVTVSVAATVGLSMLTGGYIISTAYGAWAVRSFLGPELYDRTLGDDPGLWPSAALLQLPLIPLHLVLERITPRRRPKHLRAVYLAPLALALVASLPARPGRIVFDAGRTAAAPLWPPSPFVCALLYPGVRTLYRIAYVAAFRHFFGEPAEQPPAEEPADAAVQIRIRAEPRADGAPPPEGAPPAAAEEVDDRVFLSASKFGRLVGGALLIPAIASASGSLLLKLSKYSTVLRLLLSARRTTPAGAPASSGFGAWAAGVLGLAGTRPYPKHPKTPLDAFRELFWGNASAWAQSDPVWWRNLLGMGAFIVVRDAITFLHFGLLKREQNSRRIKSRPFRDVDTRNLDLRVPTPEAPPGAFPGAFPGEATAAPEPTPVA